MNAFEMPSSINDAKVILMRFMDDGAGWLTNCLAALSWHEGITETARRKAATMFRRAAKEMSEDRH